MKKCILRALCGGTGWETTGKIKEVRQCLPSGSLSTREVKINTPIIIRQNVVIALGVTNKVIWDSEQGEC